MTRIDELQKKYPDVHKHIIAKFDINTRGVKDTPDLDKVSGWALPNGSYQSYDHDYTLKDIKAKGKIKDGYILRPRDMRFSSGLGALTYRSVVNPYEVRDTGNGKFALFDGEEKVNLDIDFPPGSRTGLNDPEVTSKGTPVWLLVESGGRNFRVMPNRFCEYFNTGDECKFCNFNPSQEDARAVGIDRSITTNLEEALEAYKIIGAKRRLVYGILEAGGFVSSETEANTYCRFVERLSTALPYTPKLDLVASSLTRQHYQRLKDSGLHGTTLQMEVWAPELFDKIVPGKAKHMPREAWVEALLNAVDVFGAGRVVGKFVSGVTLLGPDGFKDLEEAKASHIEGNNFCIKNGVYPGLGLPRWAAGSQFSKDPANRFKFPPSDYHLDIMVAHHQAMMEHGLYPKLDVLQIPSLSAGGYTAEMGIFAGVVSGWQICECTDCN